MGPGFDQKLLKPTLVQIAGEVISMVRGQPGQVRIFINDEEVGYGAKLVSKTPPGQVTITAKADDYKCKSKPSTFKIKQNQTVTAIISCEKIRTPTPATGGTTGGGGGRGTSKTKTEKGCKPDRNAPHGYATIVSVPFSEVWYRERKIGDTPLNKVKLPAGCNELTFIFGKKETKRVKKKLQIQPNQTNRYKITLN